jgi:regulator of replication initiation timing
MNHPLTIYFKRWKYEKADSEKVLARLSKKQLIDKVVADENLIGSSKSRIQRMDQAIDHLNIQRDSLCEHFIKGQRLALAKVNNNCHATLFRSFSRWKKHCQDSEQAELADELSRTNEMISELSQHVQKLEGINKNLLVENEELRSAALDGIEIAKAVQDLTKERETLSHDLSDRAATIKKLIEENNALSLRLTIAQKEMGMENK